MAVYKNDRPDHLREALLSVVDRVDQVLVGTDGPVPSALDSVLAEVRGRHANLSVTRFPSNRGLAHVLNDLVDLALADADCELIFRMDADDISHPNRFELQRAFMNARPDIGVAGSYARVINMQGQATGADIRKPVDDTRLKKRLAYDSPFVHPSVVFRASLLRSGCRYPTHTVRFEDVAFWALLARQGVSFGNVQEHLLDYRQSEETTIRRVGWEKSWSEFLVRAKYVREVMPRRVDILLLVTAILFSKIALPPRSVRSLYAVRKALFRS